MLASLVVFGAPLAAAADPADAGSENLDPLLAGVDDMCRYSDMLEHIWRALPDTHRAYQPLQPGIRTALGPIDVQEEADFSMYTIPVRGHWREIPVTRLQFGLGKGNGIHVLIVEFGADPGTVRDRLSAAIRQSKLDMAADPDNTLDATTDLIVEDGKAQLICDLST